MGKATLPALPNVRVSFHEASIVQNEYPQGYSTNRSMFEYKTTKQLSELTLDDAAVDSITSSPLPRGSDALNTVLRELQPEVCRTDSDRLINLVGNVNSDSDVGTHVTDSVVLQSRGHVQWLDSVSGNHLA